MSNPDTQDAQATQHFVLGSINKAKHLLIILNQSHGGGSPAIDSNMQFGMDCACMHEVIIQELEVASEAANKAYTQICELRDKAA